MQKISLKAALLASSSILIGLVYAGNQSTALAQEISGSNYATATAVTGGAGVPVEDLINTNNGDFGAADANSGLASGAVSVGVSDNIQSTSTITVVDSVGGSDVWTVNGAVSIAQDAITPSNTDKLVFEIGSSDGGISDILSTGITFISDIIAGTNGQVDIDNIDSTNADTITFQGDTTDLGSGSLTFSNASDRALFSGSNPQTFSGEIDAASAGDGIIEIANDTTLVGNVGFVNNIENILIDAAQTLTIDADAAAGDIAINSNAIELNAGSTFEVNARNAGGNVTINSPIAASSDGVGTILTSDTQVNQASNTLFNFDIGSAVKHIANMNIFPDLPGSGNRSSNTNIGFAGDLYVDTTSIRGTGTTLTFTGNGVTASGSIIGEEDFEGDIVVANTANVTFEDSISVGGFDVQGQATIKKSVNIEGREGQDGGSPDSFALLQVASDATLNVDASNSNIQVDVEAFLDFGGGSPLPSDSNDYGLLDLSGNLNIIDSVKSSTNRFADFSSHDIELLVDGDVSSDVFLSFGSDNAINIGTRADTTFDLEKSLDLLGSANPNIGAVGRTTTFRFKKTDDFDPSNPSRYIVSAFNNIATLIGDINFVMASDSQLFDDGDEIVLLDATGGSIDRTNANVSVSYESATTDVFLEEGASTSEQILAIFHIASASELFGLEARSNNAYDTIMLGISADEAAAAGGTLEIARNNLGSAPTVSRAQYLAESIAPIVNRGELDTAISLTNKTYDLTSSRTASLRSANLEEIEVSRSVWGHLFGINRDQDKRSGYEGYDANTFGGTVGVDTAFNDSRTIAGVAFTYSQTDIDSKAGAKTNNEIDTYQATLYARHDLGNNAYLSGQASYAFSQNDTKRYDVGGSGQIAYGDYDSNTVGAKLELGQVYETEALRGIILTPSVSANYLYYNADSYTETGADTANLNVDYDSASVFELGAELEAGWSIKQNNGATVQPSFHVGASQDLIGDAVAVTSNFVGAGPSFVTNGADPAQTTFNTGFEITYDMANAVELSLSYDFDYRSDYDAHTGLFRAIYRF